MTESPKDASVHDDISSDQTKQQSHRSLAEWVSFAIASFIVGSIAGLVVYAWVTDRDRPPLIIIKQTESIREENGQFYIPFEVLNKGGETATAVQVIAELEEQGTVEQRGDLQVNFISPNGKQEGTFVFTQDPREGNLMLRVGGYEAP